MKILIMLTLFIGNFVAAQNASIKEAKKYFEDGELVKAEAIAQNILQNEANNRIVLELLGDIKAANKEWIEATDIFERLVDLQPKNAEYHFKYGGSLGMAALDMPKIKAAFYIDEIEEHLLKAAQLDANHIDARWALVKLYLELPSVLGGSIAASEKYANQLYKISKVDGYLAKAHIAETENNLQETEKFLKMAVQVGQSEHTFEKLADFFKLKKNDPSKAIEVNEKAFLKLKKPQFALEVAEIAANNNISSEKGLKYADLYLQKDQNPSSVGYKRALFAKAKIFYFQNKKKEALAVVNKILEQYKNDKEALLLKKKITQ